MDWIGECKEMAMKLPRTKRQEFIDLIHKGKTIGEAIKETGVSFDESSGIMNLNLVVKKTYSLNKVSV